MNVNLHQPLIWVLKLNVIVWIVDLVLFGVLVLLGLDAFGIVAAGYFSKVLLLEAGVIFVVGGAVAFSSGIFSSKVRDHISHSEERWSVEKLSKSEKKANLFIITGVFLFLQALIVSFFGL